MVSDPAMNMLNTRFNARRTYGGVTSKAGRGFDASNQINQSINQCVRDRL